MLSSWHRFHRLNGFWGPHIWMQPLGPSVMVPSRWRMRTRLALGFMSHPKRPTSLAMPYHAFLSFIAISYICDVFYYRMFYTFFLCFVLCLHKHSGVMLSACYRKDCTKHLEHQGENCGLLLPWQCGGLHSNGRYCWDAPFTWSSIASKFANTWTLNVCFFEIVALAFDQI